MENSILDDNLLEENKSGNDFEYAGFWIRVGASLLDMLALIPIIWLATLNNTTYKSLPIMILLSLLSFAYKPLMEGAKGATLGKMALGLKVVDYEFGSISMNTSFMRSIPWFISTFIGLIMSINMYSHPEFGEVHTFLELGAMMESDPIYYLNTIYSFIFLGLIGSLVFSERKQGAHDKIANTYCIKTNKS